MAPSPSRHRAVALALALALGPCFATWAARVPLKSVEADYHAGPPGALLEVIDGRDAGKNGWSIAPHTGRPQSIVFQTASPVHAEAFDITLCFLSGKTGGYFHEFSLSYTSDPTPSLHSKWNPLTPERVSSVGPDLKIIEDGRLEGGPAHSMVGDAIFELRVRAPRQNVTGFRIDVIPCWSAEAMLWQVAWSSDGDFCLTEFRVEAVEPTSTNLALGCSVRASHVLWANIPAAVLTDGLPGSYAHPAQPDLGTEFFFEIDLGSIRQIDHITLRSRSDGYGMDRMSRLLLRLYDRSPDAGGTVTWEARDRADGSHPRAGESDIVRAAEGKGTCRGQFLRISSESGVALSPQLAEVEVYGTLTPTLAAVNADGRTLPRGAASQIPAGSKIVSFPLAITGDGAVEGQPVRWRLRGYHNDWQVTHNLLAEAPNLPSGVYHFEAQVGHSDGEWDTSVASVPLTVLTPFWRRPIFSWSVGSGILLFSAAGIREITRRRHAARIAALEYHSALATERTRIARDMHDEVGARLSQLAVMQDLVIRQHSFSPEARQSLERVAETARSTATALDEVVWAVNPRHDTLPSLAEYLGICATSYLGPLEITCELDAPLEWSSVQIHSPVRHQLALAFKEALQNVVKHADATEVTITLRQTASDFIVKLRDNGVGFPEDPVPSGRNGLKNMHARLASVGGICEVRRLPEGGTEVEMHVPFPK